MRFVFTCVMICTFAFLQFIQADSVRAEEKKQPNVLFIAIDDLRTELGCYGHPHVQSPALDRLAAQGVLFTNHFVQVPTCGASRYALLTGRSPRNSGVTRSNQAFYRGKSALSAGRKLCRNCFAEAVIRRPVLVKSRIRPMDACLNITAAVMVGTKFRTHGMNWRPPSVPGSGGGESFLPMRMDGAGKTAAEFGI